MLGCLFLFKSFWRIAFGGRKILHFLYFSIYRECTSYQWQLDWKKWKGICFKEAYVSWQLPLHSALLRWTQDNNFHDAWWWQPQNSMRSMWGSFFALIFATMSRRHSKLLCRYTYGIFMMPRNSRGPLAPIHVQKHTVSLKQPLCSTNNDCVAIMITLRDDDTAIDCQHFCYPKCHFGDK